MAQIFNSHSQRDENIKNHFYRAFSGTRVVPIWQEYEEEPSGPVDKEIERKIQASSAVFVLLSENVEKLPFTRDWILWECGKVTDKDIWVFEPYEALGKINVVIPRFNHYVRYERNISWRDYINSIVKSYDDSSLFGWAAAGAGLGSALNPEDRGGGAVIGTLIGAVIESARRPKSPSGHPVICLKCYYSYRVHLPCDRGPFRCAKCNNMMEIADVRAADTSPLGSPRWASLTR